MRISDWSSDVCSSDLPIATVNNAAPHHTLVQEKFQSGNKRDIKCGLFATRTDHRSRLACHAQATYRATTHADEDTEPAWTPARGTPSDAYPGRANLCGRRHPWPP